MLVSKIQQIKFQQITGYKANFVTNPQIMSTHNALSAGVDAKYYTNVNFKGAKELVKAAEDDDVDELIEELKKGTDINALHCDYTALMSAINEQSEYALKELIKNRKLDINKANSKGQTALMTAAETDNDDIFDEVLNHPYIDVNRQDKDGWTALHYAVDYENEYNISKLLERQDIDVNIKDFEDGRTALMFVLNSTLDDSVITDFLAHNGIDVNVKDKNGDTVLIMAVKLSDDVTVNKLLDNDEIDLTLVYKYDDEFSGTAADIAEYCDLLEDDTLKRLRTETNKQLQGLKPKIKKSDISKLSPEENIWSPEEISDYFLELVRKKKYEDAITMLKSTPLINLNGKDKNPILLKVCSTGKPSFVEEVFNYKRQQKAMLTKYNNKRNEFLEKTINKLSYDDLKANMFAMNTVDGFKVLMTKPEFNPNDVVDKISLFEKACILDLEGNLAKEILSKYGNVKTSNASKTRNSVIKDLIKTYEEIGKYKIIMNQIEDKAFVQSERELAAEELQKFMESEDFKPEIVDSVGNTVLHIAATLPVDSGQKLIRMAIDKGIDKDAGNIAGQTALMSAVKALVKSDEKDKVGRTNLLANIKFLLDKGVNIDAQDNNGKTAFHFACMGTVAALLELLITKNPNVLLLDKTNMRACAMLKTPEMKRIYNNYLGAV